jgi:DNA (cytosine-5)-methyltransferase 1
MPDRFTVVDLYSGAGGLSLGAERAGFHVLAAAELDPNAITAHRINFPETLHMACDVSLLTGSLILKKIGLKKGELGGLIGGPPCQGFSTIGRRDADDPRNSLFSKFFALVSELEPAFFLAENVPGIMNERNDKIRSEALALIPKKYISLPPLKIKASDYGAPTARTRVFFIGYDPTKLSLLTVADFLPNPSVEQVKVKTALQGLPVLDEYWETSDGVYEVEKIFSGRFGKRVNGIIPKGVGDKEAIRNLKKFGLVTGFVPTRHSDTTLMRLRGLPQGVSDPISKCPRLSLDGYCPTLRAGTGPEKGSYQSVRPIHPLSDRVITPREAARLQGFPDWFQFHNSKWHAFRQIGNSVSPIVAEEILSVLHRKMTNNEKVLFRGPEKSFKQA